jgi:ABC-type nitrate/sulfonate/bicarbonate transport system substrate-binding protein
MRSAIALAALVLAAILAPGRGAADEPVRLRYGQAFSAVRSIYSLPTFVADREGFFAREGLAFHNVLIPGGGANMVKALQEGDIDLTHIATPFLITQALAGSDAVAIAAEFDNPIYSLLARPEIAGFADLKGHVIGMADPAGTIAYSSWKLLALNGVREDEVTVELVSGTPQRLACLRHGPCVAVPLGQPEDFEALDDGYRRLGVSSDAVPQFLYTVTAARRSWAEAHRSQVVGYVRALAAAFRFIRDPAQRDAVVAIAVATEAVSASSARRTLQLYFEPERHVLPEAGEIEIAGLRQVIRFMADTGALQAPLPPAERFVDLSYLHDAGIE